ncbi:MAG: histidine phosphatase family protein [Eubacteriaceae bacterium]|jgi:alpha-ribazole phosphatase|nr:histidine phosphatase family protein [Eubacteriaceae bacterium]
MDKTITLIRHGQTEGNRRRWYYGSADLPLSQEGAEELKRLAEDKIYPSAEGAKLFTSGMTRTNQTLQEIYGDISFETVEALREMRFGVFEKHSYEELKNVPAYQLWISDTSGEVIPEGGESRRDFCSRIYSGWAELEERSGAKNIAVLHGGPIAVIMMHLFGTDDFNSEFIKWIPGPGHGYTFGIGTEMSASYRAF